MSEVTFKCAWHNTFKRAPERIDEDAEDLDHPWRYFAPCPHCGAECTQVHWERSLLKAWRKSTGPKTDAGKAATALNLVGHPTAEEALRTRFNAMKHGAAAKVATYFPARPGKYAMCESCDVDITWCANQPCCVKQTQNFMLHQAAFEQRKPGVLTESYAEMQAAVFSILQQIIMTIVADGVKLTRPEFHADDKGNVTVLQYLDEDGNMRQIKEVSAHPLLKPLSDFLTKNNLSLSDMGMTNKVIEAEDVTPGNLLKSAIPVMTEDEYRKQQVAALSGLRDQVMRSNKMTADDPILREFNQENGGGKGDIIDVDAIEK